MKRLTIAATLAATAVTFAVQPSLAMDNPVQKNRAKVERILDYQDDHYAPKQQRAVTASTSLKQKRSLDRYERAHQRLFGFRHAPAGR